MSSTIQFSIRIPTDAQSRNHTLYVDHNHFIKYCKANKVKVSKSALEAYEREGLLFPCIRVLSPRELLRRRFRADHYPHRTEYNIRDEWKPLIDLESALITSQYVYSKAFTEAIKNGHPFEQAVNNGNHPFVSEPEKQRFKAWKRYKVIVGEISGSKLLKSKAEHYYSPWKIFLLYELNRQNTDTHNRATGGRGGWGIIDNRIIPCSLNEFSPFFKIVSLFSYRRYLIQLTYYKNTQSTEQDWEMIKKKSELIASSLFITFPYGKWIRFLRKQIELHERYKEGENILLSEESKSYIGRTVIFTRYATGYKFQKICGDVSGQHKKQLGRVSEDGVVIYPDSLEEMFPDEKWDLEQNVKWILEHELKQLNSSLVMEELIPESLADQLFDELSTEPEGTALAAIRKINKAYSDLELWQDHEIWSGIRDLAISIEDHGRKWLGGKSLDGVFKKLFGIDYSSLRKKAGRVAPDADNTKEFLDKLALFQNTENIPKNKRSGNFLLIAYLTRNFCSHHKGLFGLALENNFPIIYPALVRTLFVVYAGYQKL